MTKRERRNYVAAWLVAGGYLIAFIVPALLGGCNGTADGIGRLLEGVGRDVRHFAEPDSSERDE